VGARLALVEVVLFAVAEAGGYCPLADVAELEALEASALCAAEVHEVNDELPICMAILRRRSNEPSR
jgi:hypothetical protein